MNVEPYFKFVFIFFLSGLIGLPLAAQSKFPQDSGYDSLLNLAKQYNKPMFLVVHQRDELFSPFALPISQKVKDILSEQFVSGVVQLDHDDIHHPLHKTYLLSTPIYLFTDRDGFPLLRHNQPIKEEETLISLIDSVHEIAKGETMGKLIAQYRKGVRSRSLLTNLLKQYQAFGQYSDQQVLNDYLAQLTVQELNNFETVIFLLKCGPVYKSKTYLLARTNNKMVDSLYTTLPLPVRMEINNRIIRQTFREALDKQNYSLAQETGHFVSQTWQLNYLRGDIGRSFYPMEYKRLLRDTSAYVLMARNHYNNYFYRVDPDSMARLDFAQDREINIRRYAQVLDSAQNVLFQQWIEKGRERYKEDQARHLSYGARQLLAFGRSNPDALFDAIRWQQKAIVQNSGQGQYHHTLAQLLYCVGFYAEAEVEQQRAITLFKSNKARHKQMRDALKQMQARLW